MDANWMLVFAGVSLAVAILSSAVGITWKLARQEMALRAEFTTAHSELSAKLYQVEIWARDEFVRKGSFEIVIARMEGGFRDLRSEISGRLDKIAERLNSPH